MPGLSEECPEVRLVGNLKRVCPIRVPVQYKQQSLGRRKTQPFNMYEPRSQLYVSIAWQCKWQLDTGRIALPPLICSRDLYHTSSY